jgi:phosphatidylserine/phosphatidylglycerophosphate/cardiolipin synthase-like enzyme
VADAIERGSLTCPITRVGLLAAGFREQADDLERNLAGFQASSAASIIRVAIAERVHRPPSDLELVWTGPLTPRARNRDTGIVMRDLFARAERDVLVGGFRFDAGADLFKGLHQRMAEQHVRARIFLDIEGQARDASGGAAYARDRIAEFWDKNWPFGDPRPQVFYDPRTAIPGPPWVSLHAKCVVVDARYSLVTSANFTDRAQTRNIELGVLIDDPGFAESVLAQWQALVTNRSVVTPAFD